MAKLSSHNSLGQLEVIEVGILCRSLIRPEHKHRATRLRAVWAVFLTGLDVQ